MFVVYTIGAVLLLMSMTEVILRAYYRAPFGARCFRAAGGVDGVALQCNCRLRHVHYGRCVDISTDSQGRRLVPASSGPRTQRTIHVLGDSQVFGWGLTTSETIPAQLQDILGTDWCVLNWGIPSTGPHTYAQLLDQLPLEDIVVVVQSDDSDVAEIRHNRPPHRIRCGFLVPDNWLGNHLPCWLTYSYAVLAIIRLRRILVSPTRHVPINFNPQLRDTATDLLARLQIIYRPHRKARGGRLLFAVVPWDADILPQRAKRYLPRLNNIQQVASMPQDIDLYRAFRQSREPQQLYQADSHVSAQGARLVAEQLARLVVGVAANAR